MANRVADLDRRGVPWKKFYNTNFPARLAANRGDGRLFTAAKWTPLPSGLIGPVTFTPLRPSASERAASRDDDVLHTVWDIVAGVRVRGRVNDRALRAARRDRSAPHAVFVHGLGMATNYLEPTMRALGDAIAVSALDLPGFGKSERAAGICRSRAGRRARGVDARARHPRAHPRRPVARLPGRRRGRRTRARSRVGARAERADHARRQPHDARAALARHAGHAARAVRARAARRARLSARRPAAHPRHAARRTARPDRGQAAARACARDDHVRCARPRRAAGVGEAARAADRLRVGAAEAKFVAIPGAAHAAPFSHPQALAAEVFATASDSCCVSCPPRQSVTSW